MMPKCAHEHSSHALLRIPVRLTRCFVPGPLSGGATTVLPAGPSAHLGKVLRLRAGADLTLFDGRGGEYPAQILALARDGVHVSIGEHDPIEREAPVAVTLLQCLARGERMDWIVQKATELGVARIVPVSSEHRVERATPPASLAGGSHQCLRTMRPQPAARYPGTRDTRARLRAVGKLRRRGAAQART